MKNHGATVPSSVAADKENRLPAAMNSPDLWLELLRSCTKSIVDTLDSEKTPHAQLIEGARRALEHVSLESSLANAAIWVNTQVK